MKKMFFFFLIPIFFVSANQNPEWLFEDAFDKEIVLLDEVSIVTPDEIRDALVKYHAGQYRFALEQILKIRRLNLPDGKLDFTSFVLAECYRQLDLDQNALKEYHFVARNFPESDKVAPALYRLLEYAVEQNNEETADSLFMIFQNRYRIHPLHNSAIFIFGKFYYVINRFGEAIQLLSQVSKQSSRYIQAQFLLGLCHINLGDTKKALSLLEYVKTTSLSNHLAAEASLLIGDIYSNNDSLNKALVYYNSVPENTSQFQIANVKITRAKLMQKQYEAVFERGNAFLKKFPNNDYFF
jgi:tetratricopeptide (TPR) repeat protein